MRLRADGRLRSLRGLAEKLVMGWAGILPILNMKRLATNGSKLELAMEARSR